MTDLHTQLAALRRPSLLIRAARMGVEDYRRDIHLRRLLLDEPQQPAKVVSQLMVLEDVLNRQRSDGNANYSLRTHIEVLIALLGETRLLRTSPQ